MHQFFEILLDGRTVSLKQLGAN
jgi:hypothetical protein